MKKTRNKTGIQFNYLILICFLRHSKSCFVIQNMVRADMEDNILQHPDVNKLITIVATLFYLGWGVLITETVYRLRTKRNDTGRDLLGNLSNGNSRLRFPFRVNGFCCQNALQRYRRNDYTPGYMSCCNSIGVMITMLRHCYIVDKHKLVGR